MASKDDDGEVISKQVLDWLTRIIALAAALATIFALFLSEQQAKPLAFGVAILLVVGSSAVFLYRRRRAARFKIAAPLEPPAPSATLRGLLPFEEGDQLPGREWAVPELYTLIKSTEFRFGVLSGESGCGKTSLLRAGLVPTLRKNGYLPLYIPKPTKTPHEAVHAALKAESADLADRVNEDFEKLLRAKAPKGTKVVIILDQFEEFFLTNRTSRARASFEKWLRECAADASLPVAFLISIRADVFAQLLDLKLEPAVPDPTSRHTTYPLRNFDAEEAKQVFNAAAQASEISFEPALISAVVGDLETEGVIRPAELQIVGQELWRKKIFKLNTYEHDGPADRILSSYISEEIKLSKNERTARLILRLMITEDGLSKSPDALSIADIVQRVGEGVQHEIVQGILNQLTNARILIRTDDKYSLVHDYLALRVRTATEGTETNVERANRLLKRYIAEYKEDPRTRIPFGRVRWIQKHASPKMQHWEKAQELINKSRRRFYATSAGILAVPLVVISAIYLFLGSSYYLSTEDDYVVVRSGHPQWKFVPGFDEVVVQTDFRWRDLDFGVEIIREQVAGFWFELAEHGYQLWGEQLVARLSTVAKARALRWFGQPERAVEILIRVITDPQAASYLRRDAATALGQLGQAKPQAVTPEVIRAVLALVTDPQADSDLRHGAASALGQLGQAKPQAVTPEVIQAVLALVADPQAASDLRRDAAFALGQLGQANPQAVTPEVIQALQAFVADPRADSALRSDAATALGQLGQANPQAVTPEVIQAVLAFVADPQAASYLRRDAATALGQLGQANPQAVTPEVIRVLTTLLKENKDSEKRNIGAAALFDIAVKDPSQEEPIRDELEKLRNSLEPHVRIAANKALEMMAIGDLVQEAREHPEQIARIKSRLDALQQPSYGTSQYGTYEEHLGFAAEVALQEIEKINANSK